MVYFYLVNLIETYFQVFLTFKNLSNSNIFYQWKRLNFNRK